MSLTRRACLALPLIAAGGPAMAPPRLLRDPPGGVGDRWAQRLPPGRYRARMRPANRFLLADLLRVDRVATQEEAGDLIFRIAPP